MNSGPLEEQSVFLTSEPSLQPHDLTGLFIVDTSDVLVFTNTLEKTLLVSPKDAVIMKPCFNSLVTE